LKDLSDAEIIKEEQAFLNKIKEDKLI